MDEKFKAKLMEWKTKVGYSIAVDILVSEGFSPSLAQKVLADAYKSLPKIDKIQAIERAMKRAS